MKELWTVEAALAWVEHCLQGNKSELSTRVSRCDALPMTPSASFLAQREPKQQSRLVLGRADCTALAGRPDLILLVCSRDTDREAGR